MKDKSRIKDSKRTYGEKSVLGRVFWETFRAVPFSAFFGALNYWGESLFPALSAWVLANLFDGALALERGAGAQERVVKWALMYLGCFCGLRLLLFIANITINAGIYEKCTVSYRIKISEKTAKLSLFGLEDKAILERQALAQECVEREMLSQLFMSATILFAKLVGVLSTMLVLATYSLWLVPLSVLSVLPYFITRLIRGMDFFALKNAQVGAYRQEEYLWSLLGDKQTAKEMRVMGFGDYLLAKWKSVRDEKNAALWDWYQKDARSLLFCDGLRLLGYLGSLLIAFLLFLQGRISLGVFGACINAFLALQGAARDLLAEAGRLPEKKAFARNYFAFLDIEEENLRGMTPVTLQKEIVLQNVSFFYPGKREPALDGINLRIKKGEHVAILGVNGSGKTTLSKLLAGVYAPVCGAIRVDGVDLAALDKQMWYQQTAYMSQTVIPYALTLRESLALLDPEKMREDAVLYEALRSAMAQQLPEMTGGMDGQLGREFGGTELSGGWQQKLALARAMARDAGIVFLDEPTSALDPLIETQVLTALLELAKGKTAIIVSHRAGLCRYMDRIVVMEEGRILENGSHEELLAAGGLYCRMLQEQGKWYERE